VKKLSVEAINAHWDSVAGISLLPHDATAEERLERLQAYLTQTCDVAMTRRSVFMGRKSVYWWSEDIVNLRKVTIASRRCYQRAGRRANTLGCEIAFFEYNHARKALRLAIRRAQERS